MNHKIPVTVAILTHNSAATLTRALESVKDFAEIIICDGQSTDKTLVIARAFGARVLQQDTQFLADNGRIQNFSGVRNQTLAAAVSEWFLFLDSDEYLGSELAEEIFEKTKGEPSAYWVPRKYVYRGAVVDCSVTYPSQQMRFFHTAVARGFIKKVHEKIELRSGIVPQWLTQHILVPMPDTVEECIAKWRGYLEIERTLRIPISMRQWIPGALKDASIAALYLVRLLRILVLCRGTRLPVSYELARVWYQWELIKESFRMIQKRRY